MEATCELNETQHQIIGNAARNVHFVGKAFIGLGALICVGLLISPSGMGTWIAAAVIMYGGFMTRKMGASLQSIGGGEGNEMTLMVNFIGVLSEVYGSLKWLAIMLLSSGALLFFIRVVKGASGA